MQHHLLSYFIFTIVLILALVFDVGLFVKKNSKPTIKSALRLTFFWLLISLFYFIFLWVEEGSTTAIEYFSAYTMEWSLSVDNIFVFIIIFDSFKIKDNYTSKVLIIGVLLAILFRIIFITLGVSLVQKFEWILYIFGVFLIYTGYKMFFSKSDEQFDPTKSPIYKFLKKYINIRLEDGGGKMIIRDENNKKVFTSIFIVVIMLAFIDIVFALDSIPAVLGISKDSLVVYSSNIFAVLGLRSLFFLLRGVSNKFIYLQQGIAMVLVFIGFKMLGEHYINIYIPNKNEQVIISFIFMIICIFGSVFYSIILNKRKKH